MNSYELFCEELRKIFKRYRGGSDCYLSDYGIKPRDIVIDDAKLVWDTHILSSKTWVNVYYILIIDDTFIRISEITLSNESSKITDNITLKPIASIFNELPAKYRQPEGAALLKELFNKAVDDLQNTKGYNTWLEHL